MNSPTIRQRLKAALKQFTDLQRAIDKKDTDDNSDFERLSGIAAELKQISVDQKKARKNPDPSRPYAPNYTGDSTDAKHKADKEAEKRRKIGL